MIKIALIHIRRKLMKLRSGKAINAYVISHSVRKLNLGCGKNLLHGWLNTDIYPTEPNVVYLDVTKTLPLPNESFQFVLSEHLHEHLRFEQALNLVKECHRVLKPNGVFRIATPDLQFVLNLYNTNKLAHKRYMSWYSATFHPAGSQKKAANPCPVINNFFRGWGHKFIYDFETLKYQLLQGGFKQVRKVEVGKSNFKELQNVEGHGKMVPEEFNRLETVVVEATK